jgi:hypothetical protein
MTDFRTVARGQVAQWFPVMSGRGVVLAGACALLLLGLAGTAVAQQTSLTVYQSGRVLVRRVFPVAVPRGVSTEAVDLGAPNVDPGTLVSLDDGVEIRGVTAVSGTGPEAALRRAVGRDIEFMLMDRDSGPRFIRGTLLSLEPQTVRIAGRVIYGFPGTLAFPDSLVRLASSLDVTVAAARARPSLGLAYQADGLQWRAAYVLTLPRALRSKAAGSMSGLATIENPGSLSFPGAQVQLLAGQVRRVGPTPSPRPMMARAAVGGLALDEAAAPVGEESVGETHLYTLAGTVDVLPGQSQSVALFPEASVQVEPEYVLRHAAYVYQAPQGQGETDLHPDVGYLVRRPTGTAFGDTPLPAGVVRVLAPDSGGRLQLLGETQIQHTPAGRDLRVVTGTAFDVTAQRTQTAFAAEGNRASVSSYRVTIQNAKSDTVTVQVLDQFPGQYDILSSTVPPERLSSTTVRFPLRVAPGGEATLEYRVRARW